jgi:hypothetical protein
MVTSVETNQPPESIADPGAGPIDRVYQTNTESQVFGDLGESFDDNVRELSAECEDGFKWNCQKP